MNGEVGVVRGAVAAGGAIGVAVAALGDREGVDRLRQSLEERLEGAPRVRVAVQEDDRHAGRIALLDVGSVTPVEKVVVRIEGTVAPRATAPLPRRYRGLRLEPGEHLDGDAQDRGRAGGASVRERGAGVRERLRRSPADCKRSSDAARYELAGSERPPGATSIASSSASR